jgi:hypothetical protein
MRGADRDANSRPGHRAIDLVNTALDRFQLGHPRAAGRQIQTDRLGCRFGNRVRGVAVCDHAIGLAERLSRQCSVSERSHHAASDACRRISVSPLANIPGHHWRHSPALVDCHPTSRVLGGLLLIRYIQGQLPGVFAIPAGVGDVLTGILAPIVAYLWYAGKPYAREAAIAWNLFGMVDLINAVALGTLTGGGGGGIVFPTVLIPVYAVPRTFLIHSYSLLGLLRNISQPPKPAVQVSPRFTG